LEYLLFITEDMEGFVSEQMRRREGSMKVVDSKLGYKGEN
jgi:hypothetical protein